MIAELEWACADPVIVSSTGERFYRPSLTIARPTSCDHDRRPDFSGEGVVMRCRFCKEIG